MAIICCGFEMSGFVEKQTNVLESYDCKKEQKTAKKSEKTDILTVNCIYIVSVKDYN